MAKDAENTSNEKRCSTWFYFPVRDEREGPKRQARFRFAGMARQGQLYKHGHRPVVHRMKDKQQLGGEKCWSTLTGNGGWEAAEQLFVIGTKVIGQETCSSTMSC